MEDFVRREECQNSILRINQRLDEILECSIEMKTSAKNIELSVNKIFGAVFGNGMSDGLITKHSNLNQKVTGIYWLGGIIIVAVVGILSSIIVTYLK